MNASEVYPLLQKAQRSVERLMPGEIFTVSDLFYGFEWKRIPKNIRITLGTLFYLSAQKDRQIVILDKTSRNQQQYQKL